MENFRKTVYGFEEVCFAEVLYGKMTKFFTSDFSMNFFIQLLEEMGQLLSILKVFEELPQTSVTSANFRKTGVPYIFDKDIFSIWA